LNIEGLWTKPPFIVLTVKIMCRLGLRIGWNLFISTALYQQRFSW